jgi:hypothetical protein
VFFLTEVADKADVEDQHHYAIYFDLLVKYLEVE